MHMVLSCPFWKSHWAVYFLTERLKAMLCLHSRHGMTQKE